ncbi:MAG: alpha-hydroxy-acid oxidizing enzyme [Bordetella sp. SCN 67-23]|mgnify:CR=1 FL=1|nr:alpha-hydroxy-acid oxidizing protein [Burkholderiales bacterium]ODS73575.1 MAG: alpha-hydroxy-acid oxidizing enzyme [Bordetella sp. SCN 67-23]OJW89443.1 MAG: alpha-hydroxy-acid oxidizing enzyme [Burkholderiales bacterium 67-32]
MTLASILSTGDLERAARRRLPPSVYGYVSGGSETESALRGNRQAFDAWRFVPRFLVDVSRRSQATGLFGTQYAAPFGIAPMGVAGICGFDGDLALARAAAAARVPFVLSGASTTPMERVLEQAPGSWFQAYVPSNRELIGALLARAERAGVPVLVVTVDVPIASTREVELRNGFSLPLRLTPRLVAGGLARPRWLAQTFLRTLLRQGIPRFENFSAVRGNRIITAASGDHRAGRAALSWDDLAWVRDRWRGRLVIKGLLHPEDAGRAQAIGADGIIVSNHGGRQLDGAQAPLDALPAIAAAAPRLAIMVDSGFRRGTDILKALALGADFVFIGRPAMYGLAVGGQAGVAHVLALLKREIDVDLALLGCADVAGLDRRHLVRPGPPSEFRIPSGDCSCPCSTPAI